MPSQQQLIALLLFWLAEIAVLATADTTTSSSWLRRRQQQQQQQQQQENTTASTPTLDASAYHDNHGDSDTFTIIFISDLENKYRGHDIDRSKYVIQYIRDIKEKQLMYDGNYSHIPITKPRLVIHGGDVSHMWSCDNFEWFLLGGCRDPRDEYQDIWNQLYEADIPMISTFGNHDWQAVRGTGNPWGQDISDHDQPRTEETDYINFWSAEFVRQSYEKSAALTQKLQYQEILPTGIFGQSMFRATFAGLQIVNLGSAFNWQSYDDYGVYSADDQFQRLSESLDRSMKTIFFSHYPLNKRGPLEQQSPSLSTATSLIREFGTGVHHFSGHNHVENIVRYTEKEPHFNDYVAPYPHTWNGKEPGFYALLVSKEKGLLQVKTIDIPGLEAGTKCIPWTYLNTRHHFYGFTPEKDGIPEGSPTTTTATGASSNSDSTFRSIDMDDKRLMELFEDWSDVSLCCNRCKSGRIEWSANVGWFVCGEGAE